MHVGTTHFFQLISKCEMSPFLHFKLCQLASCSATDDDPGWQGDSEPQTLVFCNEPVSRVRGLHCCLGLKPSRPTSGPHSAVCVAGFALICTAVCVRHTVINWNATKWVKGWGRGVCVCV